MEAYLTWCSVRIKANAFQDDRIKRLSRSFNNFDHTGVTVHLDRISGFDYLGGHPGAGH